MGGYCCQGGSAVGGDLLPGGRGHSHVNRMTHACKNITFPQLHWRAVITQNRNPLNTLLEGKMISQAMFQIDSFTNDFSH